MVYKLNCSMIVHNEWYISWIVVWLYTQQNLERWVLKETYHFIVNHILFTGKALSGLRLLLLEKTYLYIEMSIAHIKTWVEVRVHTHGT